MSFQDYCRMRCASQFFAFYAEIVEMNGTLTVEITETMDKTLMVM